MLEKILKVQKTLAKNFERFKTARKKSDSPKNGREKFQKTKHCKEKNSVLEKKI